jgi:hypothetical protein
MSHTRARRSLAAVVVLTARARARVNTVDLSAVMCRYRMAGLVVRGRSYSQGLRVKVMVGMCGYCVPFSVSLNQNMRLVSEFGVGGQVVCGSEELENHQFVSMA